MNTDEYTNLAVKTAKIFENPVQFDPILLDLLHAGFGLATEAGEFLDALKRHIFYGKELDEVNLQEELGDVMWYIALICKRKGWSMEKIMEQNIAKLSARFPHKFTESDALNRELGVERQVLEQTSQSQGA